MGVLGTKPLINLGARCVRMCVCVYIKGFTHMRIMGVSGTKPLINLGGQVCVYWMIEIFEIRMCVQTHVYCV
jgi:hypothetical protein